MRGDRRGLLGPHRQGGLRRRRAVRVLVLGGGDEPVFLHLIKDGQTVLSESIAIARTAVNGRFDRPRRSSARSSCTPIATDRTSCRSASRG